MGARGAGRGGVTHLGVSRAQHDKLGWVDDADALTLHCVESAGGAVQHHIYQAIIQQVHLIHIQDPPVGSGLWHHGGSQQACIIITTQVCPFSVHTVTVHLQHIDKHAQRYA